MQGYDQGIDDINDFVRLLDSGSDTILEINADGDVGGSYEAAAVIISGLGGQTVDDLLANGVLVADQTL